MAFHRVDKRIYEEFYISGSILRVAASGETINLSSSSVTAVDNAGTDATADVLYTATKSLGNHPSGGTNNILSIRLKAGTEALSPYCVSFFIVTTDSNQYQVDAHLYVNEQ